MKKIPNSQPWSRPTRQRSAAHQWAAAHRLRTGNKVLSVFHRELTIVDPRTKVIPGRLLFREVSPKNVVRIRDDGLEQLVVELCAGRAAPPPPTICGRRRRRLLLIGAPPPPPPIIYRRAADIIVAA